jgi:hypothetical protein
VGGKVFWRPTFSCRFFFSQAYCSDFSLISIFLRLGCAAQSLSHTHFGVEGYAPGRSGWWWVAAGRQQQQLRTTIYILATHTRPTFVSLFSPLLLSTLSCTVFLPGVRRGDRRGNIVVRRRRMRPHRRWGAMVVARAITIAYPPN